MEFKAGQTYHIIKGIEIYKIHIVSVIDENQVVYKWFGKQQRWWHYNIILDVELEIEIERYNKKILCS